VNRPKIDIFLSILHPLQQRGKGMWAKYPSRNFIKTLEVAILEKNHRIFTLPVVIFRKSDYNRE
jgi:hypothetical protein